LPRPRRRARRAAARARQAARGGAPMTEAMVGLLALVALIAYAVLAGADFGAGVWDLLPRGPRRAAQRAAIAHAMGPVGDANHVWLIFVVVLLFAGFPDGYAVLSVGLYTPFHLVLLGIILRGAAFVFRAYSPQSARALIAPPRAWGAIFGAASVITPLVLGMSLGAVSAGTSSDVTLATSAWLRPVSWLVGLLTLSLCAYLAAVFLANETEGAL